ncbi:hypothetical protein KCU90_g21995, partial [Aureobasidium melanogenum]
MSEADKMAMLYRLTDGVVSEQHYGLQLAKVMPLPPDVTVYATRVAEKLHAQVERRKKASKAVIVGRKRKLILGLREELIHACGGAMEGPVLQSWLQELQRKFEARMTAIEREADEADLESLATDIDDVDMADFETVTNNAESVRSHNGHEGMISQGVESTIGDDSNIMNRY